MTKLSAIFFLLFTTPVSLSSPIQVLSSHPCFGVCPCQFFFFSSRRRHTRWPRDWSSDVCSSDLIDARIERALRLSKEFLEPLSAGAPPRNSVDDHVEWLKSRPDYRPEMETEYRKARSSEQIRVAEDVHELYETAGVLLVDAQGHGIISAKIASTVHDTFHALMLAELDRRGKTTPELFERLNLRLAQSVTARNALGISEKIGR